MSSKADYSLHQRLTLAQHIVSIYQHPWFGYHSAREHVTKGKMLMVIYITDGEEIITQADVGRLVGVSNPNTLKRIVTSVIADGYITYGPHPTDRRKKGLFATDKLRCRASEELEYLARLSRTTMTEMLMKQPLPQTGAPQFKLRVRVKAKRMINAKDPRKQEPS